MATTTIRPSVWSDKRIIWILALTVVVMLTLGYAVRVNKAQLGSAPAVTNTNVEEAANALDGTPKELENPADGAIDTTPGKISPRRLPPRTPQ